MGVCAIPFRMWGLILCWLLGAVVVGVLKIRAYHLFVVALWEIVLIKLIYHEVGF